MRFHEMFFFDVCSADLAIEARPFVLVRWGILGLVRALSAFCRFHRGFRVLHKGDRGVQQGGVLLLIFPLWLARTGSPIASEPDTETAQARMFLGRNCVGLVKIFPWLPNFSFGCRVSGLVFREV